MTPEDNTANSPMLLKMVFGLSLFLTAVLGYWFYSYQQEQMQRDVESDLAAIAKLKIGQIGQWRKERLGDANVLSEDRHISATWKK